MTATLARAVLTCIAVVATLPSLAHGDELTPIGRWKTIDDNTGKAKSIVLIWEENGKLAGKVESIIVEPGEDPNPTCTKCEGAKKDQPVIGMEILWGLSKNGSEWSGGQILDPDNGKTYKCYIEPVEGGAKLKVRGYIGFALLGRTQYWLHAQ